MDQRFGRATAFFHSGGVCDIFPAPLSRRGFSFESERDLGRSKCLESIVKEKSGLLGQIPGGLGFGLLRASENGAV